MAEIDHGIRQLCPDGACIGLLDDDGRCKVCGRLASDDPFRGPPPDEGPADRQLCSDGACIGVIGADGRCNECGRPASPR